MIIAVVLLTAIVTVVVSIAATRPPTFSIQRHRASDCPKEALFKQVSTFRSWQRWSPWEGLDPAMKRTYSGPDSGVGAEYAWDGNDKAGAGSMKIVRLEEGRSITLDLVFLRPWKAQNEVEFVFEDVPEGTKVTWVMRGQRNFFLKLMSLFFDMDQLVGKDFEKGLASLETVARDAT